MRRRTRTLLTVTATVLALLSTLVLAPGSATAAGGGTITGRVTDTAGAPVVGAWVSAIARQGFSFRQVYTDLDGRFLMQDLANGQYQLSFSATGFVPQNFGQPDQMGIPELLAVTPGVELTADTVLYAGTATSIFGHLAPGFSRVSGDNIYSAYSRWDGARGEWTERRSTVPAGMTIGLVPGHYLLETSYLGPDDSVTGGRTELEFDVVDGVSASYDPEITPTRPAPVRVTGTDRFGTAVKVSQRVFEPGVPVVYVTNGLNFADALGAGPAAAEEGGPVLLVTPTNLPAVVAAELTRLAPARIVVLGGFPSVSAAVEQQLRAYAPVVERVSGTDRFQTSRNLAETVFDDDSGFDGSVFIVNGLNFPDGLSAGTAAASMHAPVILVNGTASAVDAATLASLDRLGAQRITVLGGANSVSTGIETSLRATGRFQYVSRIEGYDRFETSAQVGMSFTDTYAAGRVYVASGLNFPDALAGAAAAAADGSPLLLIPPTCMTGAALYLARWTATTEVVFLGGDNMIATSVERFPYCGR